MKLSTVCTLWCVCLFLLYTENQAADCKDKVDLFKYFKEEIPDLKQNNGLLKWSKVINTVEELQALFLGNSHMIKANVVHNSEDVACIEPKNPNDEPSITLEDFLKAYKRSDGKLLQGLMLHLKTQKGYESTLDVLEKVNEAVTKYPLWLHMNVAVGPGGDENVIDPKYETYSLLDCFTTSLGLTTGLDPSALYTDEMMKNVTTAMKSRNDFYAFRGVYLKKSWNSISQINPIVVWIEEEDVDQIDKWSMRNMLYTRRSRTFRDIPEELQTELDGYCQKNQNMYDFFKNVVDLSNGFDTIKWYENVRSVEELEAALGRADYHMIKANIIEKDGVAVIEGGTLSLRQLLGKISPEDKKGVKLHFVTTQGFEATARDCPVLIKTLEYPIWMEANIFQGPGGSSDVVDLNYESNKEFLSCHHVSLGWTTTSDDPEREYTREMILEMRDLLQSIPDGPFVVISMRAMYVYKAVDPIDGQLHNFIHNFYFWADEEDDARIISKDLRDIKTTDIFKGYFYFDIPESMSYRLEKCPNKRSALNYFDVPGIYENLTLLEFSEFINGKDSFMDYLQGNVHMIKATVSLKNNVAVVGEVSTFPLEDLFEEFRNPDWIKGLVLRFQTSEAFGFTLREFYTDLRNIEKPIWLHTNIAKGPGGNEGEIVDVDYLLNNDAMDCCTMVYGWSMGDNDGKVYTEEDAMAMEVVEKGRGSTVYALRAEYTSEESLSNLKPITNRDTFHIFLPNNNQDDFVSKNLREVLFWGRKVMYVDVKEHYLLACPINQDVHEYVGIGRFNLSNLVFSEKPIGSLEDLKRDLDNDNIHMLKANVFTTAGVPMVTETLGLLELLQKFDESDRKKGIELTLMSSAAVQDTIRVGLEILKRMQKPIWIRAHVVKGPGNSPQTPTDLNYKRFNDALDCRDVVLVWTTNIHQETETVYTEQQVKAMSEYPISARKIFYEIRGEFFGKSWETLTQTFPADFNTFKLWISYDNDDRTVVIAKEMRDIVAKYFYAFYIDLPEDLMRAMMACPIFQDVYTFFFNEHLENNATVLEFHGVIKNLEELESAMNSGKHMINIEIYEMEGEVVVQNVPADVVSLGDVLNAVDRTKSHIGLQLLFQTTEAFNIAMKNHYNQLRNINHPIWINANVVKGPGGGDDLINIDYNKYNDLLDCRNMVLGWSTDSSGGLYTVKQIEDMKKTPFGDYPKIYSIRAMNLLNSWENLKSFKDEMFLLWSPNTDMKSLDADGLKDLIGSNERRFFLDFSDDVRRYINGATCKNVSVVLGFVIFTLHLISI